MNKWCCSKSTQRDLQQIKRNAQEEYARHFVPVHKGVFRPIPAVICVFPSFFTIVESPIQKTGFAPISESSKRGYCMPLKIETLSTRDCLRKFYIGVSGFIEWNHEIVAS